MTNQNATELFPPEIRRKLRENDGKSMNGVPPTVKIFNPMGSATWLLHSADEADTAFGLCDLGFGSPELGYVGMAELEQEVQIPLRSNEGTVQVPIRLERDLYFRPKHGLEVYARAARKAGYITEDPEALEGAAREE